MKYKNILWIDDCDTKDGGDINIDDLSGKCTGTSNSDIKQDLIINDYFHDYYEDVKLIKTYDEALNILEKENTQYDLVIFDMNMKEGINNVEKCKEKLSSKNVYVDTSLSLEMFKENAGMYLYLFLLNCGYPNNRMIILSAYVESQEPQFFLEKASIKLNDDNLVDKRKAKIEPSKPQNKNWIKRYYTEDYYRVRKLVFKACEYWKESLIKTKKEDIAFNQIYYSGKKNKESSIESEVFIGMLERIKMLFPVAKPQNCEELYYQALQVATIFHEEGAKIDTLKGDKKRKYHQAIRNFRNWSAHNKFLKNKIPSTLFAYLFCITLRSYFQEKDSQFIVNQDKNNMACYDVYEKEFFNEISYVNWDVELFKKNYIDEFNRHLNKLKDFDDRSQKNGIPVIYECEDMNGILLKSGMISTTKDGYKMLLNDLLLNIIEELIKKTKDTASNISTDNWKYIIKWNTEINIDNIQEKFENDEDFFEHIAYLLFIQSERNIKE